MMEWNDKGEWLGEGSLGHVMFCGEPHPSDPSVTCVVSGKCFLDHHIGQVTYPNGRSEFVVWGTAILPDPFRDPVRHILTMHRLLREANENSSQT